MAILCGGPRPLWSSRAKPGDAEMGGASTRSEQKNGEGQTGQHSGTGEREPQSRETQHEGRPPHQRPETSAGNRSEHFARCDGTGQGWADAVVRRDQEAPEYVGEK